MNLGELYIKISTDTSGIDSLKKSFESAASAAENAGNRIDKAFGSAGSGASGASSSTDDLGRALEQAAAKGQIFADVIEGAFQTAIDLAGKAISAVGGFIQDSVGQFAAYEQNLDSMNITFKQSTNEFMGWMQDNSSALGLSMNQMMEHANKTGTLLQKSLAEQREKDAAGEQETTEQKKQELSNRLSDLRASLSNQLSETREAQSAEYNSWKEYYANVLSELKSNLQGEYDALKESLNKRVEEQRKANEQELRERTQALDDSYREYKNSLDSELDSLKDSIAERVELQRAANETELRDTQRALEDSYNYRKLMLDAEVSDFTNATNERIKQINREYTEQYKLIDEEKYAKLKAIQDKIDAIDDERKANKRLAEDEKSNSEIQRLREQLENTLAVDERKKILEQIDSLEAKMEQQRRDRSLSDQKDFYNKEKKDVEEHYDNIKESLKQKQQEEVDEYKDSRTSQLNELKLSNAEKLKELKRANQDELEELKNSQKDKISQIEKDGQEEIKERQRKNERLLNERKRADDEELRQLRNAQSEQISSIQAENDAILKDKQSSNNQILKEQEGFNNQQLENLKLAQSAELREIQEHNRQRLQEEQNYINEQKKLLSSGQSSYAEVDDVDREKSVTILQKLFGSAADIAAARNMTTEQVLQILEGVTMGRFATFDNLGLGYANKSGLEAMVANMNEVYQQLEEADHQLDATNFGDVVIALDLLIDKYGFAGKAAKEAEKTVAGSFNALKATWTNFVMALGTEGEEDDAYFLKRLIGDGDQEGVVKNFLNNVIPVIERIVSGVSEILTKYGPQIADAVGPLITLVVNTAAELIRQYGPTILGAIGDVIAEISPKVVESIGKGLGGIGESIGKSIYESLPPEMQQRVDELGAKFKEMGEHWAPVAESFKEFIDKILPPLQNAFEYIQKNSIEQGILPALGYLGDACDRFMKALGKWAEPIANVAGLLGNTLGGAVAAAIYVLGGIIDVIAGILQVLHKWADDADKSIANFSKFCDEVGGFFANFGDNVGKVVESVVNWFKELPQKIMEKLEGFGSTLYESGSKLINGLLEGINSVAASVWEFFKNLPQNVLDKLGEIGTFLLGTGESLLNGLLDGINNINPSFLTFFVDLPKKALESLGEIGSHLFSAGQELLNGFLNGINDIWVNVSNWFIGLPSRISEAIGDPLKWLEETGKNLVEGFKNGINNAWEGFKNWITEQFNNVSKWVADILGIHSPSTVFAELGKNTIDGFKNGASGDAWDGVKNFFGSIGNNITDFFNGAGSWLTEKGNGIINGLKGGIDSVWPDVQSFFGGVNSNIQNNFNGSDRWLNGDGNDIINGMHEGLTNAFNSVQSFFGSINGEVLQHFNDSGYWLNGDGKEIISGLESGIVYKYRDVNEFFGDIPDSIGRFFYNTIDWLFSNGQNIMTGLYNGLVDTWNHYVVPFISGIGDWIHNNDGPEREDKQVLYDNGKWFIEGLANGMRDAFPLVEDAVSEMVELMDIGNPSISMSGVRRSNLMNKEKPINVYMTYNAGEDAQELVYDMVGQLRRYGYTMGGR